MRNKVSSFSVLAALHLTPLALNLTPLTSFYPWLRTELELL